MLVLNAALKNSERKRCHNVFFTPTGKTTYNSNQKFFTKDPYLFLGYDDVP
jgi:hypothetical protein